MAKSAAFGALHLGIAFSLGYAFTGSIAIAGGLALVEPLVNTVAHYFFDRWWQAREARAAQRQQSWQPPGETCALTGAAS